MKLKNIEAIGHCGIEIHLNLMDQIEVTHLVNRYADLQNRLEERKAYRNMSYDERVAYDKQHGAYDKSKEPTISELDELAKFAFIFLSKLALGEEMKSSVFSEE